MTTEKRSAVEEACAEMLDAAEVLEGIADRFEHNDPRAARLRAAADRLQREAATVTQGPSLEALMELLDRARFVCSLSLGQRQWSQPLDRLRAAVARCEREARAKEDGDGEKS